MLKSYIHKSLISHVLNHVIGIIIFAIYLYILVKDKSLLGIKDEYDVIHSPSDALSFVSFFIILLLLITQARKGYLLYIPSTYLSFGSDGISFKRLRKENRFIKWEDIAIIDLSVESEWLLTMFIKEKKGNITKVELSELWLLSITKKWCVHHNFLKFAALASKHPNLMEKLVPEQMEALYNYSGVK